MNYTPCPIDTDHVQLNDDLMQLTEKIAQQVHETWAFNRVKDGWVFGDKRDDTLKTTPCLVPYSDLPESEKQFDRDTAVGTIKLICALGYKIKKGEL